MMRRSLWILVELFVLVLALTGWLLWPWHFVSGPYGSTLPPERAKLASSESGWTNEQQDVAFGELTVGRGGRGGPALVARRADGSLYWQYRRLMTPEMPVFAAVHDDLVVAVWCDDWVVGIDVPAGRIVWSTKLPPGPSGAYCVGGNDDQRVLLWAVHTQPDGRYLDVLRLKQSTRIDTRTGQLLN